MRDTLAWLRAAGFVCKRGCTMHDSCRAAHAISTMRGALSMLSQAATLPSDVAAARAWLRDALADFDNPSLPDDPATDSE